jgi:hypothetical protein
MQFWTTIGLILVLSAVGLTYEIAAGRVLAPYFGTSLLTWTTVIATVLAGFSLGSALGGFIAERAPSIAVAQVRTALLGTAVLMALSPTILGLIHGSGARGTAGMMVAVVLTFFPASVLITLPSPFLAKCAIDARPGREGSSLGIVLAAGSLGAILGAILAGFLTLPLIGSTATFAGCGAITLVCLWFIRRSGSGSDGKGDRSSGPPSTAIAGAFAFIGFAGIAGAPACQYESGLSCLHIERQAGEIRLFSDRTLQAAEPASQPDDVALSLPYVQWIWGRLDRDLGPAPSILFVGGGGYTLPTTLLAQRPAARAVAVEIDPLVTQVVRQHMPRASAMIRDTGFDGDGTGEGRLGIVHADARVYINETDRRFDAAVMDAFSSSSVPAHLVTRETYERLHAIVDGPVYVNLIDTPDGPLARGVHTIMSSIYPNVQAVTGPVNALGRANVLLAASREPLPALDALPEGYEVTQISPGHLFTDDRGWVGHR